MNIIQYMSTVLCAGGNKVVIHVLLFLQSCSQSTTIMESFVRLILPIVVLSGFSENVAQSEGIQGKLLLF